MENVETWNGAMEKGLDMRAYTYDPATVPTGELVAVLDFKVWARGLMGIGCYFTEAGTGLRFLLTVYRDQRDQQYGVKGCPIDFTVSAVGVAYGLKVELNGKGNPFIREARLLDQRLPGEV